MKKWAVIIIVTIGILGIVIGCQKKESTKEELYEEFQKKILTMSSYKCTASVEVVGNKSAHNYVFIHNYNKPDNYKLEVVSPEHLKGKTIEYNKDKILVKNPDINDTVELPNVGKNDQYMFIGDFIKNYLQSEEVMINLSKGNLCLETSIPGDNQYFNKQVLYINSKTKVPEKMEILDDKNDIRFTVTYKDFEYKK
ncbi:germination lipoprotein GerS [[Clostridium] dakarense]|uniref:germination lipoprotein GerS n=1 Tax=Faecalimicrobium dakarense TaxID=1301100 RepID=UPI0004ADEE3F|nr:germination lipoprotein GerS [[Clostridium] dakarense]